MGLGLTDGARSSAQGVGVGGVTTGADVGLGAGAVARFFAVLGLPFTTFDANDGMV
jgi:hypothetical protein